MRIRTKLAILTTKLTVDDVLEASKARIPVELFLPTLPPSINVDSWIAGYLAALGIPKTCGVRMHFLPSRANPDNVVKEIAANYDKFFSGEKI